MNLLTNIPIKLSIFSSIYFIVLLFISPMIDHLFKTLEEDKLNKDNNLKILIEIIIHLIVLIVAWYFLHKYLSYFLENLLNVKIKEATKSGIDLVSAIALIGLQKNLIDKLEYITHEHPFRRSDFYLS